MIIRWLLLHVSACVHVQVTKIAGLIAAAVCLISDSPSEGIASGGQTTPHLAGLSHSLVVPGGRLHQLHGLSLVSFPSSLLLLDVLMTDDLVVKIGVHLVAHVVIRDGKLPCLCCWAAAYACSPASALASFIGAIRKLCLTL